MTDYSPSLPILLAALLASIETALPATFVVTNTADTGPGSLRQALQSANNLPGPDVIQFNIAGTGVHNIVPFSDLPFVTDPVAIDGSSQPGYSGKPLIVLSATLGQNNYGLALLPGNCLLRALTINGFPGAGVLIYGSSNVVEGCFVGTDADGLQARPNGIGILVASGSLRNLIGGVGATLEGAAARNLLSGNSDLGLCLLYSEQNTVQGNFIGTDITGTARLANRNDGLSIDHSSENNIGGTAPGEGNLISGNGMSGIRLIEAPAWGNVIQGNLIGTDVTGTSPVGNSTAGITLSAAPGNTIGGTEPGARNIISGNHDGIGLERFESSGNAIEGNFIGVDLAGSHPLSNAANGVYIFGAVENTIGGADPGAANVISANQAYGIEMGGTSNVLQGNFIGTDSTGTFALPNGAGPSGGGVHVTGAAHTIGGDAIGSRNIISGNAHNGLTLDVTAQCVVQANWIGIGATGQSLPNGENGLLLTGGSYEDTIGGITSAERNVCSGNGLNGIALSGPGTSRNVIVGNYVGTGPDGKSARPNGAAGISLRSGASDNLIGGTFPGESNLIAYNRGDGVLVADAASTGNSISGNSIFANAGIAINLQPPGEPPNTITPNDPTDGDTGPNGLQNYPVITNVTYTSGITFISGSLRSTPDSDFQIELFASDPGLYLGFADAQRYLGSMFASTDSSGYAAFQFAAPGNFPGQLFSATATSSDTGDTSELGSAFPRIVRITQIRRAGTDIQISFTTDAGGNYRVEWSATLPTISWNIVSGASNVAGIGTVVTISDSGVPSTGQRFYRIHQFP